jgi:hypothetical protein
MFPKSTCDFSRPCRDEFHRRRAFPALETPGYCHPSLRDVILSTSHAYFVENLNTVFDLNVSPGFRIVVGKSG